MGFKKSVMQPELCTIVGGQKDALWVLTVGFVIMHTVEALQFTNSVAL